MDRQEFYRKAKDAYADAKYYFGIFADKVREYPKTSAALAIAILSFAFGAYVFAATVTCQTATYANGVLTCATGQAGDNPAPVPTPAPTPAPPPDSCPSDTLRIKGQFGNTAIDTGEFGSFGTNILVVEIKVPADFSGSAQRTTSWVEYGSGPSQRHAVLSTKPCDFTVANAVRSGYGAQVSNGPNRFSFVYSATGGGIAAKLTPGVTYYLNVRNLDCTGDCRMRGSLPK